LQVKALSIGEIRELTICELFKRKFHVVGSLKVHLKSSRTVDEATEMIFEWSATDDIRYELAHDLQEDLEKATGLFRCSFCHWVTPPGEISCDDKLDALEQNDEYPYQTARQERGNDFDGGEDDAHLELDSDAYVMERV